MTRVAVYVVHDLKDVFEESVPLKDVRAKIF